MDTKELENPNLVDIAYQRISSDLKKRNIVPGTRLQPIRKVAKAYDVSYLVAQKAIRKLQDDGVVEARPGDGIYYTGGRPEPAGCREPADRKIPIKTAEKLTRNHSICVVMPYWLSERGSAVVYSIIKGILSESDCHHWSIELIHSSGDEGHNESGHPDFIEKIEKREADGIIWLQPIVMHKMNLMRLIDRGYKVITTGRSFSDVPVTCIQIDYEDVARKIVAFLIERDVRDLVMVTGPIEGQFEDPYSVVVVKSIQDEMQRQGLSLPYEKICQAAFSPAHEDIIHRFMERHRNMDGIISLHEHYLGELEDLDRQHFFREDRKIPMIDISGIFNMQSHPMTHFDIFKIEWPTENMGRAVVREFEKIWGMSQDKPPLDLGGRIIQ